MWKRFGRGVHGYQEAQPENEEARAQAIASARHHCVTLEGRNSETEGNGRRTIG